MCIVSELESPSQVCGVPSSLVSVDPIISIFLLNSKVCSILLSPLNFILLTLFNCATVTASESSLPSAKFLSLLFILSEPIENVLPLVLEIFVKYESLSSLTAFEPLPIATESLCSTIAPDPIAIELSFLP
ncbi:hypothetical protein QQA44_07125 [Sneathia vaginalis]|nr:hypothetical protein [Sneathia vaginalis]MDK9582570.1 hypothetical protein [Sneathia vaginalis]